MSRYNIHIAKTCNFKSTFFNSMDRKGVPLEKLMRNHSIKNFDLSNPESYLPLTVFYDFLHKTDQFLGTENLATYFNSENAIKNLGVYGTHILKSENLLDFLQEAIKYQEFVATNLRIKLEIVGVYSRISFVHIDPPSHGWEQTQIITLAHIFEAFKIFGGEQWHLVELQIPSKSAKLIEDILPPKVSKISCCQPYYGFTFHSSMLRKTNAELENDRLNYSNQLSNSDHDFANCVIQLVDSYAPGRMPSIAEIASYLDISVRTVHRKLKKEGRTFTEIRNQSLFLRSLQLIESQNFKIYEIAESLGFSNAANFVRFFKEYSGTSPGQMLN